MLLLHFGLLIIAFIIWKSGNYAPLLSPYRSISIHLKRPALLKNLKSYPELWLLGSGLGIIYLFNAFLIIKVPPNNWDSMTCHLSRVGYWLQNGSLYPWPTHSILQTVYPINAQGLIYWSVLFSRSEIFAGFIQWFAAIFSMLSIYGLSRFFNFTRPQGLFAAFIWGTFNEIILQSTTTQNHLVASTFFLTAVYLLYQGLVARDSKLLALSALSIGLALGTHQLALFMLPGLAITLSILAVVQRGMYRNNILKWSALSLFMFLSIGGYMYAMNYCIHQHPLGPRRLTATITNNLTIADSLKSLALNSLRYVYQSIDFSGLPTPIVWKLTQIKGWVGDTIFNALSIPIADKGTTFTGSGFNLYARAPLQEDSAWFGPLVFLLLWPAVIYQCWTGLKNKDIFRLGLLIICTSLLVCLSVFRGGWTPFQGRYFVPAVSLCAVFIAPLYSKNRHTRLLLLLIILLALSVSGRTTLFNESKPVLGSNTIWNLDRNQMRSLMNPVMNDVLTMIDNHVPSNAAMGIIMGGNDWDYPLFGQRFGRTIIPIFPPDSLNDPAWFTMHKLDFILLTDDAKHSAIPLYKIEQVNKWALYSLKPLNTTLRLRPDPALK